MEEIFWLEDDKVCGRCGPRMVPWNLDELWKNGIRSILCVGDDSLSNEDVKKYEFVFQIQKLPDSIPPNDNDEKICKQYLPKAYEFLKEQLLKKRPTLIHCHAGKDRTSLTMVYYLIKQKGMTYQEALDQVRSIRKEALSAPGWESMANRIFNA